MKNVLLIFDDVKELDFIEHNLFESGFNVSRSSNLKDGLVKASEIIPDLIVVNTIDNPKDINQFSVRLKTEQMKNVLLLCLIELEDYLHFSTKKHFVIKPVRPKLLLSLVRGIMNDEEISWALAVH
jgi:two-component system alkaline phosphatase synthesis response regulator PhoP